MNCKFCGSKCVKNGYQSNGKQRIKCTNCYKKQRADYSYQAYTPKLNEEIKKYIKESASIRGIARLLEISTTTLLKRILEISKTVMAPHITANVVYEVDEIKTFIGRKIISGLPTL